MYGEKIEQTISLLKQLSKEAIVFVDDYDYETITEVGTCMNKEKSKCELDAPLCMVSGKVCQLVLPKINLVTNYDNERNYFARMADELIRYNRIKSFIFEPRAYLSLGPLDYRLREDEIILMQSLITQEYFKGLIPVTANPYVKYRNRDTSVPR